MSKKDQKKYNSDPQQSGSRMASERDKKVFNWIRDNPKSHEVFGKLARGDENQQKYMKTLQDMAKGDKKKNKHGSKK